MKATNLIENGDFLQGSLNELPQGWIFTTPRPGLAPVFRCVEEAGERLLMATGAGNADCLGFVAQEIELSLGKTYRLSVQFRFSEDLDPQRSLLFQCFREETKNGIFDLRKNDGWARGEAKIHFPGEGMEKAEVRIVFRFSPHGRAWIRNISLEETVPDEPRFVRVVCTQGKPDPASCRAVLRVAGESGADIALLPEYMRGEAEPEPIDGPSGLLMAEMARRYSMYVAGGIVRVDDGADRLFNTVLFYDRDGQLAGTYDKIHPYSPELFSPGITPGRRIPVFDTDFGKIGFMICYDSWFTDVTEVLALKGAQMILFPNAGYYRSLMPARCADNCVRIAASSWNSGYGVWDTVGREVTAPEADPTHKPVLGDTFRNVKKEKAEGMEVLIAELDFNCSPSPAYNGGTMMSAPGGKRNRRDQLFYLDEVIRTERSRWWVE